MTHDDDTRYWRTPKPPNRVRRIGCLVIGLTLVPCACSGLVTGVLNHGNVSGWPLAVAGIGAALLLGWLAVQHVNGYLRLWRLRLHGEIVLATVKSIESTYDGDGDYKWSARVVGRTRSGDTFSRQVPTGYREPPEPRKPMAVRYYTQTKGIDTVQRTVGDWVSTVVVDLFALGVFVVVVYLLVAIIWAEIRWVSGL